MVVKLLEVEDDKKKLRETIIKWYKWILQIFFEFQKRWPTTHVLLITPPPIDEEARLRYFFIDPLFIML